MKKIIFGLLTVCLIAVGTQAWALPVGHESLLAANYTDARVHEFDPGGGYVGVFPFSGYGMATGVDIGGPVENVFIATNTGWIMERSGVNGSGVVGWKLSDAAWDIKVTNAGDWMYATSRGGYLAAANLTTVKMTTFGNADVTNPFGLDISSATGAIYVVDAVNYAGTVNFVKYEAGGVNPTIYSGTVGITSPRGIALLEEDLLAVADVGTFNDDGALHIVRLNPDGTTTVEKTITSFQFNDVNNGGELTVQNLYAVGDVEVAGDMMYIADWGGSEPGFILALNDWMGTGDGFVIDTINKPLSLAAAVPEPATFVMVGCGIIALIARRRRK
jgi:hypothetical protein